MKEEKKDQSQSSKIVPIANSNVDPSRHCFLVSGTVFNVPKKYELIKVIGKGAYGVVVSAKDTAKNIMVAIKKVPNAFMNLMDAKRIVREIKILKFFNHENIILLVDVLKPENPLNFEDIYIVTDLLETDLHRTIYSHQDLTDDHLQYFIYQILRGLLFIHSSEIIHRDLKPSNLLLTQDCDLKICDFGLSRGFNSNPELTEYVVTRWYRAPEIILNASEYSKAIDIWSVGCIMAEVLGRKPFFPGNDYLDQIKKIVDILGTPTHDDMSFIESEQGKKFIKSLPKATKKEFSSLFPKANKVGLDLLSRMLAFNPKNRLTVEECLAHHYFNGLHSEEVEIKSTVQFDWSWDNFKPTKEKLQEMVYKLSEEFNP